MSIDKINELRNEIVLRLDRTRRSILVAGLVGYDSHINQANEELRIIQDQIKSYRFYLDRQCKLIP